MSRAEQNKSMLLGLYNAVVARSWEDARNLLAENFIEHNPRVPHDPAAVTGREAFIAYFRNGGTPLDGAQVEIKRMIADDHHAVVHYKLTSAQRPRGVAVVDIFRVEDGRFTEHWDVLQDIPEESANPHGMIV
jgi:predicted SnoaL-like aldol condensation-catalyzing enzyme